MANTIKVTPQELISASSEFKSRNANVANITQEMLNMARDLAAVWEGEAATAFINRFNGLDGDMQQIRAKLDEHAEDLQAMAQAYMQTEDQVNVQLASSIPNDLIS